MANGTGNVNRPGPTPDPTPNTANASNRMRVLVIVLAVLVVALGGLSVYLLSKSNQQEEENAELTNQNQDLMTEIESLNTEVSRLEESLQASNLDAEQKQQRIQELLNRISGLQGQVNEAARTNKLTTQQVEELRAQLAFYQSKYEKRIQELVAQNQQLTSENTELRTSVDTLRRESSNLRQTVTSVQQENTYLANPIRVSGFSYKALDGDRVLAEGTTLKRNKLKNKLRICASTNQNDRARTGLRDVFLVVRGPNEKVVQSLQTSSGKFNLAGHEVVYTAKTSINFNGNSEGLCFDFVVPADYDWEKGPYSVTVYIDGVAAGNDSFQVRPAL